MGAIKRIGLILLLIFLLPALFFSVYEINSLSKDEAQIKTIYENQLEAILFSANQYSDDILSSWIAKIELGLNSENKPLDNEAINNLVKMNESIQGMMAYQLNDDSLSLILTDSAQVDWVKSFLKVDLTAKKEKLNQLISYQQSGFQKVEPFVVPANTELIVFLFRPNFKIDEDLILGIIINPEYFIEDIIGPRLQFIAQDKFAIVCSKKGTEQPIYATYDSSENKTLTSVLDKDLWLLPDYTLGISTLGTSIDTVIKERSQTNLWLIIMLDIVLIFGVVWVFRNVRKEVQLAQNKSDFIANVSHEIRTPLALISMFAETLEMNRVKTEEKKLEYYSIINKETQRLTGIVNKILSFSQLDAGKKTIHLTTVDVNETIREVLETYEFHLNKEGFEVQTSLEPNLTIKVDKDALVELIINLIDNAIKYSDTKKLIEIKTVKFNHEVVISIRDYGVGISKHDQKYIFDKFYRVSSGNLAKKQGTGLGLSLVKQIVTLLNGRIELDSDLGKGTTFNVYFPYSTQHHD